MTTPAINRNDTTFGSYSQWNGSSWVPRNDQANPIKWDTQKRAASGTSSYVDGFRPCRVWAHEGMKASKLSSTNMLALKIGQVTVRNNGYTDGAMWVWNPSGPQLLVSSNMAAEATTKALNDLKNQKIHIGVALAEGRRTINMVTNRATTIARQVIDFKRRFPLAWREVLRWQNGRCLRQNWSKIPSGWLEIQYGWKPLLSDILGAMEQTKRKFDSSIVVNAKGSSKQNDVQIREGLSFMAGSGQSWRTELQHESKCFVSLWYQMTNPDLAEVSSLGLVNPAEIVWEMVPFSFVVDWFLPIGPWLSALTADKGFSYLGGSRSEITRSVEFFRDAIRTIGNSTIEGSDPSLFSSTFKYRRICLPNPPEPRVYVKNPLASEAAKTRIANAFALLALAFKRR